MKINFPEVIYAVTDFFMKPLVCFVASTELISSRLQKEEDFFEEQKPIEYLMKTLATIHARASSMVSHLSIMLGLCTFLMQTKTIPIDSVVQKIVTFDTFIYIVLVLLTVRCLRSVGLNKDFNSKDEYIQNFHKELVFKYQIMQIVNAFTIFATVILVTAMVFGVYG